MRARVLRALAAGCALAAGWLALPLVAGAVEPQETGWWSRENGGNPVGAPVPAPRPADVPENGLLVAADPAGEAAVAALRFRSQVATSATLSLTVADGLSALAPPEVAACPAGSGWSAADHGEWFLRPESDCELAQVAGVVSGDVMTWALTPAFKRPGANTIEVVLLPASALTRVAFEPPGPDALTAPVDLGATTTSAPPPPPATVAPPLPNFGGTAEKSFGGPRTVATTAPTTAPTTTPTTAPANDELAAQVPASVAAPNSTGERILAVVLLATLALAFALAAPGGPALPAWAGSIPVIGRWAGSERPEKPKAGQREGGVGRFVRSREDPPTRL